MPTPDTLTLARLPDDVIRTIVKLDCGHARSASRMIGRLWNSLVCVHFKSLPTLPLLCLRLLYPYGLQYRIEGKLETNTLAHFKSIFPTNTTFRMENEEIWFEYEKKFSNWKQFTNSASLVLNKLFQCSGAVNILELRHLTLRFTDRKTPREDRWGNMTFEIVRTLRNVKVNYLHLIDIPIHHSKKIRAMIEHHNVFEVGTLHLEPFSCDEICDYLRDIVKTNLSISVLTRCSDAVADRYWLALAKKHVNENGASSVIMCIGYEMDLEPTMIDVRFPCAEFMRLFDEYF